MNIMNLFRRAILNLLLFAIFVYCNSGCATRMVYDDYGKSEIVYETCEPILYSKNDNLLYCKIRIICNGRTTFKWAKFEEIYGNGRVLQSGDLLDSLPEGALESVSVVKIDTKGLNRIESLEYKNKIVFENVPNAGNLMIVNVDGDMSFIYSRDNNPEIEPLGLPFDTPKSKV